MNGAFSIRTATASDTHDVTECVNRAYEHYQARLGKPPGPMLQDYRAVIEEHPVYVGTFDSGGNSGGDSDNSSTFAAMLVLMKYPDFVLIDNVAVLPRFQGTGLGRQMLEYAEQMTHQWGYQEMQLYTHIKMVENILFYEKLGWSSLGERTVEGYQRIYMTKKIPNQLPNQVPDTHKFS